METKTAASQHLAQLNIGRLVAPVGDARVAEFVDALDKINAVAERSPGFVWRHKGEGNNNMDVVVDADDPLLASNLSVWESLENLEHFVWNTLHRHFYQRRANWFEPPNKPHFVMWHVPKGHRPSLQEALMRLDHLRKNGDSPHGFGWAYLPQAKLWKSKNCNQVAAE